MTVMTFIGLGLNDENGISLEGLEEARHADTAFAEFYTNLMPNLDLKHLEQLIGKKVRVLDRAMLEEEGGSEVLAAADRGRVAFLVPGDPMIATTHVTLRLSLLRKGVKSRIIHAPSISSAVPSTSGLQSYKFGKAVTMPYDLPLPKSVLDTISNNRRLGLHTLLLLDVKPDQTDQLTIREASTRIIAAEPRLGSRLAVGLARLGARDEKVKASRISKLVDEDFGKTPHSIVIVGRLHFMEVEALRLICGAQDSEFDEQK